MTAQNQITPRSSSEPCNTMGGGAGSNIRVMRLGVAVLLSMLACACATGTADKDGVPTVDLRGTIVQNTDAKVLAYYKNFGGRLPVKRVVTVDKAQLSLSEFVQAYCKGHDLNPTCARAKQIIMLDATHGPRDSLPVGV